MKTTTTKKFENVSVGFVLVLGWKEWIPVVSLGWKDEPALACTFNMSI